MDEVKAVKDILREALTRIDQIPQNCPQANEMVPSSSQNHQQQRQQMPPPNIDSSGGRASLLHRAQTNFR